MPITVAVENVEPGPENPPEYKVVFSGEISHFEGLRQPDKVDGDTLTGRLGGGTYSVDRATGPAPATVTHTGGDGGIAVSVDGDEAGTVQPGGSMTVGDGGDGGDGDGDGLPVSRDAIVIGGGIVSAGISIAVVNHLG